MRADISLQVVIGRGRAGEEQPCGRHVGQQRGERGQDLRDPLLGRQSTVHAEDDRLGRNAVARADALRRGSRFLLADASAMCQPDVLDAPFWNCCAERCGNHG